MKVRREEEEPLAALLCGLGWVGSARARPELHHPLASVCVWGRSVQLPAEGPYVSASILCAVKTRDRQMKK